MELNPTTLIFEAINFVVLALVLWRVLYRPLREAIDARQAAVQGDLEAASVAREETEALRSSWQAREQDLNALREEVRHEALDAAEAERSRILERAREDASAELARVKRLLATEREASEAWVRSNVWARGTELAGHMLLALAPGVAEHALGERLLEALEKHADEVLDDVGDESEPRVEIAGTRSPDGELVESVRRIFTRHGKRPRVTMTEDPALGGGWTVRVGDRLFDGSVAGQLEVFRELAREVVSEERP